LGNALNISWKNMCPFIHPPLPLISRVLDKFKTEIQERLLIIQNFPGQKYNRIFRTSNSLKTNLGIKQRDFDRGIPNEKTDRCSFREEVIVPAKGTNNVPTEKQFSSFYSKPSSLLIPYILLQPEINMGKTIWQLSRDYIRIIRDPNNFSLCTIAFCKKLIIKIRPDLETYIFMIIKDSHILSYKYFFLYAL
jgi:hypothetical protein